MFTNEKIVDMTKHECFVCKAEIHSEPEPDAPRLFLMCTKCEIRLFKPNVSLSIFISSSSSFSSCEKGEKGEKGEKEEKEEKKSEEKVSNLSITNELKRKSRRQLNNNAHPFIPKQRRNIQISLPPEKVYVHRRRHYLVNGKSGQPFVYISPFHLKRIRTSFY